jgi:hypothetical protein
MSAPKADDTGLARYVIWGVIVGIILGGFIGLLLPNIGYGFGVSIGMILGIAGACGFWFARRPKS